MTVQPDPAVEVEPPPGPPPTAAGAGSAAGGHRPGWRAAAVVTALALAVVAGAVLVGHDGTEGASAPPTTLPDAAPTTPSTAALSPLTSMYSTQAGNGPVFTHPLGASVVALVKPPDGAQLVRVDLDTGLTERRLLRFPVGDAAEILVRAGGVTVTDGDGAHIVTDDGRTLPLDDGPGTQVFAASAPDAVWAYDPAGGDELRQVRVADADVLTRVPIPAGTRPVAVLAGDRTVVEGPGGLTVLDPATAAATPITDGTLVLAGAHTVIVRGCHDCPPYGLRAINLATGAAVDLDLDTLQAPLMGAAAGPPPQAMGPDDAIMALWVFDTKAARARLMCFSPATGAAGTMTDPGTITSPALAWTPDGQALLWSADGALELGAETGQRDHAASFLERMAAPAKVLALAVVPPGA